MRVQYIIKIYTGARIQVSIKFRKNNLQKNRMEIMN